MQPDEEPTPPPSVYPDAWDVMLWDYEDQAQYMAYGDAATYTLNNFSITKN